MFLGLRISKSLQKNALTYMIDSLKNETVSLYDNGTPLRTSCM